MDDLYRSTEQKGSPDGGARSDSLRALTFLAPGIPRSFFETVTGYLTRVLSRPMPLVSQTRSSGPMHGDSDPFGEGRADLGFLCSPSYLYLRSQPTPSVELVPAGFVFGDARHAGEPVYFSDVVVRAEHPAREFGALAGGVWGFNDECSLSGYFAALQALREIGSNGEFFGSRVRTGSHRASIEAVLAGEIDAAAIDSTVLALSRRARPELTRRLRVIASWGPFPIQPVVVRSALGSGWAGRVASALLAMHEEPATARSLAAYGFERCVPIDERAYAEERRALCDLGQLPE